MSAKSTDGYKGFPIPVGTIFSYAGNTGDPSKFPKGYLICDGGEYDRVDYPELFRVIGTTYGSSDPSLFAVPDFTGIYARNATVAGVVENKAGTAVFDPVALTTSNLPTFGGITLNADIAGTFPEGSTSSSKQNTANGLFPDSYPMTTWTDSKQVDFTSVTPPVFNYSNGTGTVADLNFNTVVGDFEVQSLEIVFIIKAEYGSFNI
ncbi:tail collar family protein [Dishui Lake virophage 2]|nr:tail collar family protein [Dishui Lake virophage 2]